MERTQSIKLFYKKNIHLRSELKHKLKLQEVDKTFYGNLFFIQKQRTTNEFYFYKIQEDGLKDSFVLSEMTFQYNTCSYKHIFILENIGVYKDKTRDDEAPLIGSQ